MFTFCPLQGACSESAASQSILELDGGVKVLIDLGWDESFDVEKLKALEKIPVYATRPVIDLGRTLTQDLYSSTPRAATTIPHDSLSEVAYSYSQQPTTGSNFLLQAPTPEEITRYFSLIQPLKYSQPHEPLPSPFSPPLNGLTITAFNAGHTLGGTIWHIQHGLESIVYAVDWNQARENVFAGAAWLGGAGAGGAEVIEQLRKPTALICSSRGADRNAPSGGRRKRDEQLIDMIKLCVSRGGTVLIPADSSGRVLELAYLLEHAWRLEAGKTDSALRAAKLYLAGRNVSSTLRYARSMLEWMDDNIVREFEATADGQRKANGNDGKHAKDAAPFDFRFMRLVEREAQIRKLLSQTSENVRSDGRVIVASDNSLEWGFSHELLRELAKDSRNLLILTDKPSLAQSGQPSIARILWDWWQERRDGVSIDQSDSNDSIELVYGGGRALTVTDARRQGLEGDELSTYQQWLATQRQLQSTLNAGVAGSLEAPADVGDDGSSESSSDSGESDNEQQVGGSQEETTTLAADCKKLLAARIGASDESAVDVFTPEVGTTVDASVDTNAWVVKLGDSLVKKLKWQNLRGLGIVTITGQLLGESHAISESTGSNKRLKTASNDDSAAFKGEEGGEDSDNRAVEVVPVLDTLPLSMVSAVRSVAQPLHVGDLRLTDLRRAMQSTGYTAEFRGEGTLVINGAVAVRKTNMGRIEVESVGVADPSAMMQQRSTFYEVKRMIYDGLAVVAGA
ncbi:cleavage and polyadenylation specificity factor subunit 2 [Verticillium alfalfae VaMs.102]|uniref:Cleavage and polyadenylation specificity factor subunit 2 n=1 Tax=Verticillium alfalfae (strain VaMs.102 / ATCC MYA-4576 / FGSC 10136) TaxID=526221 RepID=C9SFK8_VERA1|nr:cleavage and polyadenylation specificity factor subunit 2 [Verticillium alfalfae VaMs.102]EEY17341.1 cleavage and polyadenylation specificity factor subunit 2 [Verticillium alfalfae VaMs.102]